MYQFLLSQFFASVAFSAAIGPTLSTQQSVWQPALQTKFQIILAKTIIPTNNILPSTAEVFDVDLEDTPAETIELLHQQGKKVICYFSAGSSEDWRSDYKKFTPADKGGCMKGPPGEKYWAGEKWLDVRSENVFNIMKSRIEVARQKKCDGIDPDNVDVYSNAENGLVGFDRTHSIAYVRRLAGEAHAKGLAMGLKNAQGILKDVKDVINFAVNEECTKFNKGRDEDCSAYKELTDLGRPVFHIEYADTITHRSTTTTVRATDMGLGTLTSQQLKDKYCFKGDSKMASSFNTVIKGWELDGRVLYCDDEYTVTATTELDQDRSGSGKDCQNPGLVNKKGGRQQLRTDRS